VLSRSSPIYHGWWIVASFVVLNIYWAGTLIYGLTVFFTPVRHAFGWNATLLASIFSLTNILTGLTAPLVGMLFDRSGPRMLMLTASGCSGLGLIALSRTGSLAGFLAAFGLVSFGFGIWAAGTGTAAVGLWFVRRRGQAMGFIFAGVSLGGLLVPVWHAVIDRAGWRTTFVIAGLALLAISVPASLVLRHRPADLGLLPDGDRAASLDAATILAAGGRAHAPASALAAGSDAGMRAALASWQFWAISAVASLVLAGSTAATVLLLPRLQEAHVDAGLAVFAATAAVLLGTIARLSSGFLADRMPIPALAVLSFVLQALGLLAFALAPDRVPVLLLFVLAFGLSSDNVRLLASLLLLRYYGPGAFGRIQGMHFLVLLPARVLGPVVAAALHDSGHGYSAAFTLFAIISLAMVVPVLFLRPPRLASRAEAAG